MKTYLTIFITLFLIIMLLNNRSKKIVLVEKPHGANAQYENLEMPNYQDILGIENFQKGDTCILQLTIFETPTEQFMRNYEIKTAYHLLEDNITICENGEIEHISYISSDFRFKNITSMSYRVVIK